jgi:2-keto-3-deoxy-L-rhamnonate aldolase RhmA
VTKRIQGGIVRENKTKRRLRQGQPVIGTWLDELRTPAVAQLLGAAGLDFLIVDMEHGPYTMETMAEIVRVARLVEITPIVRIPHLSWEWLGRVLDAGAQGLMLPRVEEAAQLEELVAGLKYPPAGRRGMASGLGNTDFRWVTTAEYIEFMNNELLITAQIETKAAVENLDALTQVQGIDVLFVGPEDLSISLGFPGQQQHPQVIETIAHVVAAVQQAGVAPGIHTSDLAALAPLCEQGVRFITYASDIELLYNGARQAVEALQSMSEATRDNQ